MNIADIKTTKDLVEFSKAKVLAMTPENAAATNAEINQASKALEELQKPKIN
jgi:hypothetical protein